MTYETDSDLANEKKIAEQVAEYIGVKLFKTEPFAPADYISPDGSIYVETRARDCRRDDYPDIVVSAAKWIEILRLRFDESNPVCYLAIAWRDVIGIIKIDFGTVCLAPFHRNGSIGTHQSDVMISIPTKHFEIIGPTPVLAKSPNWNG